MKYTPEERLAIGKRIYEGEINVYQAAVEYGIGETCARNYMRRYRSANGLSMAISLKNGTGSFASFAGDIPDASMERNISSGFEILAYFRNERSAKSL